MLTTPPPHYTATRESLRSLACYVISPARKQRTGRIGLRSTGDGFGTPPFDDGGRIVVRGDRLFVEPSAEGDASVTITTLRDAAAFLGLELSPDPGVGHDLPPYEPDTALDVDEPTSQWLGQWYAFGSRQLDQLRAEQDGVVVSEAQIWPEHFDLAVTVGLEGDAVNIGFSPGDRDHPEPYVYVGPHDLTSLHGKYWNAPFGAVLSHADLRPAADPDTLATDFVAEGLQLFAARAAAM